MPNEYEVVKGNLSTVQPTGLKKIGGKELKIAWSDGHESIYGFRFLRQNCQCALCIDEWSGKPLLARESIDQNLEGLKVSVVGQYALSMHFSDGHSTGLYTFSFLRKLCPCDICTAQEPSGTNEKNFLDKDQMRGRP